MSDFLSISLSPLLFFFFFSSFSFCFSVSSSTTSLFSVFSLLSTLIAIVTLSRGVFVFMNQMTYFGERRGYRITNFGKRRGMNHYYAGALICCHVDFNGKKVVLAFYPAAFSGNPKGGCEEILKSKVKWKLIKHKQGRFDFEIYLIFRSPLG